MIRPLGVLSIVALGCGTSPAAPNDAGGPLLEASSPDSAAPTDGGTVTTCTGKLPQPLDNTWTIVSKGTNRTAKVHVPAIYDRTKPTPVVLNFHGYTSDAAQQEILTQMTPKSDKEGFIVVYPQGLNQSWNAGACCGQSAMTGVDDVQFVSDLIDALEAQLCVDAKRVFATGMSNGGFLSHRLACELSNRVAAVAPVAGVLGIANCKPARPVPVMHFHGTADALVPWNGSPSLGFPSVPDTFAGWAMRDGCTGMPVETYRKSDSHCATYANCAGGSTVTLCTVDNGGHTWPGGTPVPTLGYTTPNISATDEMWTFFAQHPLH
jgi:polyhydroxybutyrate depolymerase